MYYYLAMRRLLLGIGFFLSAGLTHAQNYKQYPLFIYSFTRYIQWPEAYTTGDFQILVYGESPIIEELNTMAQAKKMGDSRTIKVSKINGLSEIRKCNILFVPSGKSNELEGILAKVSSQPILVITEEPGTGQKGSCINFITKDGKLAFELNQSALNKQNLKVSNELAKLAIMI
jgi:hypothetical protein